MSNSSGGIGIFGIIFWGVIGYNIFFSSDDTDEKDVDVVENDKPAIVEQVKEKTDVVIDNASDIIEHAKKRIDERFEEMVSEEKDEPEPKKEVKQKQTPKPNNAFSEEDRYGYIEDRW